MTYDIILRGGTVVDGGGAQPFEADVAIRDGRIAAVGSVMGAAVEEIDALGKLVTPGFVDIHTHYDAQVTWDRRMLPSAAHGVTTAVIGNCGVGFAPCRPEDRQRLISLMEGIEDIPEIVMTTGLPWSWRTFPEYLDVVAAHSRSIDVVAQLPHSPLRVFVMRARAAAGEIANHDDLNLMRALAGEAMAAGAIGFSTSRSIFHRAKGGAQVPTLDASERELDAIAQGMAGAGHGVMQVLFDFDDIDSEFSMLARVARRNGRRFSLSVALLPGHPDSWSDSLRLLDAANRNGVFARGQIMTRPTGMLLGLDLSYHPFSLKPTYQAIAHLPLAARVNQMRRPEVRARMLAESSHGAAYKLLELLEQYDRLFVLGDTPEYLPRSADSVASVAARQGADPAEVAYDLLLEREGTNILFLPHGNYPDGSDGDASHIIAMFENEHTLLGLGDGGAHYGMVCDASYPTYVLAHWTRDSAHDAFALPKVIRALSHDNAEFIGLADRGLIRPGYRADVNVIDLTALRLHPPAPKFDLPGGARRVLQSASGYVATIVNGVVTWRNGTFSEAYPGRLVRGPRAAPVTP